MTSPSARRVGRLLFALGVAVIPEPAHADWVVAAYLGAAHTATAPLTVTQPAVGTDITFISVPYAGQSLDSPLYYGYRLTFFPRDDSWFGVEAEFIHLKAYAETTARTRGAGRHHGAAIDGEMRIDAVLDRFSISHGLNFLVFNAVARCRVGPRMFLAARAGAGPTVPHAESTIDGVDREGYEWGSLGIHAAGGIGIRAWRGLAVLAEYKFTRTRQTASVDRGEARGRFLSHHGVFGIAWHF